MIVSLEWLKDYIDIKAEPEKFCERMIMSGSNLETMELVGNMENVVVGKIVKIEKHPDADKLVVCQLDVGQPELVQIVTGAPNVFEGAYVPVALHNSRIPGPLHGQPKQEGGTKITKGKLRGVESYGMLCSFGELGFEDKVVPVNQRDGIWILDKEYPVGSDFADTMELKDAIIDFEITPNRPDCLSMLGMAREAAATFDTKFEYPDTKCQSEEGDCTEYINVEVKSPLCKRYMARVLKDVKIADSPWWIQRRLIHAGMRPINNIVDITNFVMLEYGQPLHAFDIESIADRKIVVDTAKDGEKFVTLDGTERTLDSSMLMINDGQKPVAVAGVMGGLNSEVEETTKTIVIESANFDANSVRTTSKKLTLRTEASSRYEKGIDPNLCKEAADRVCRLIELIGAGTVLKGEIDIYKEPEAAKAVEARVSRINSVLGIELSREEMVKYLEGLEMKVEGQGDQLIVTAPTVRQDIEIEEDIVEEVARIYGYDRLPVTIPLGNNESAQSRHRDMRDLVRETLCALGANEIQTYSFVSPKSVDSIRLSAESPKRNFVKILNPLGEDTSVMRTTLMPQMLETMGRNHSRNREEMKAFEIGNTFVVSDTQNVGDLPMEKYSLSIGMYGKNDNFFVLKGLVEETLKMLGIKQLKFEANNGGGTYHPGRCAKISAVLTDKENPNSSREVELGLMGEIHPDVADTFGIGTRCYATELMLESIIEIADTEKAYRPLPKYPSTSRDIALLVDEDLTVGEIEKVIKEAGTELLRDVKLFDIYRGIQVAEGKKSAAFQLTYRNNERTLTDDEVSKTHTKVLEALKEKLNAVLREI